MAAQRFRVPSRTGGQRTDHDHPAAAAQRTAANPVGEHGRALALQRSVGNRQAVALLGEGALQRLFSWRPSKRQRRTPATFEEIRQSPAAWRIFYDFAIKDTNPENVEFLDGLDRLRRGQKTASSLFNQYIKPQAADPGRARKERLLNLPGTVARDVTDKFDRGYRDAGMFDKVEEQCVMNLAETMTRLMQNEEYYSRVVKAL